LLHWETLTDQRSSAFLFVKLELLRNFNFAKALFSERAGTKSRRSRAKPGRDFAKPRLADFACAHAMRAHYDNPQLQFKRFLC